METIKEFMVLNEDNNIKQRNEENLPEILGKQWALIKNIYSAVLKNDDNWHFLWEDNFFLVRYSESLEKDLLLYLDTQNIIVKDIQIWNDNSEVIRLFKKQFIKIMNGYSEMALSFASMSPNYSNLTKILDRLIHVFFVNFAYVTEPHRQSLGVDQNSWESYVLADYLINRDAYNKRYTIIRQILNQGIIEKG